MSDLGKKAPPLKPKPTALKANSNTSAGLALGTGSELIDTVDSGDDLTVSLRSSLRNVRLDNGEISPVTTPESLEVEKKLIQPLAMKPVSSFPPPPRRTVPVAVKKDEENDEENEEVLPKKPSTPPRKPEAPLVSSASSSESVASGKPDGEREEVRRPLDQLPRKPVSAFPPPPRRVVKPEPKAVDDEPAEESVEITAEKPEDIRIERPTARLPPKTSVAFPPPPRRTVRPASVVVSDDDSDEEDAEVAEVPDTKRKPVLPVKPKALSALAESSASGTNDSEPVSRRESAPRMGSLSESYADLKEAAKKFPPPPKTPVRPGSVSSTFSTDQEDPIEKPSFLRRASRVIERSTSSGSIESQDSIGKSIMTMGNAMGNAMSSVRLSQLSLRSRHSEKSLSDSYPEARQEPVVDAEPKPVLPARPRLPSGGDVSPAKRMPPPVVRPKPGARTPVKDDEDTLSDEDARPKLPLRHVSPAGISTPPIIRPRPSSRSSSSIDTKNDDEMEFKPKFALRHVSPVRKQPPPIIRPKPALRATYTDDEIRSHSEEEEEEQEEERPKLPQRPRAAPAKPEMKPQVKTEIKPESKPEIPKQAKRPPPAPKPRSVASSITSVEKTEDARDPTKQKPKAPPVVPPHRTLAKSDWKPPVLDLELTKPWFVNDENFAENLPKVFKGLNFATAYGYNSKEHFRILTVRLHDLSTAKVKLTWPKSGDPTALVEVEKKFEEPPHASSKQLLEGASLFGEHVASWCETKEDKTVGDGECWTLAHDALEKGCGKHAFVSEGLVHGALTLLIKFENGKTERVKSSVSDGIKRGDILQFENCCLRYPNKALFFGSPDHTAVVTSVSGSQLNIIHQNVNGNKFVVREEIDIDKLTEGTIKVYRPVTSKWIEDLSPVW
ncbi:unnamed protein product [Kuraishia capsulata CBS 1993]|uniref:BBC1/AIM3 cysteine proteinase-fold domain-containing protein n=1 Tax=Kuraishia capsulata CBS 1993 TaxID=1382522 RepID=W6MHY2_9ASCO|nr:uncharacterized protein KUCA_T00001945001 [Kuraishia capsulata CBS 1993]CDK25974.1 unnamed protein product [Kuraishia capsulata CBS 1993]